MSRTPSPIATHVASILTMLRIKSEPATTIKDLNDSYTDQLRDTLLMNYPQYIAIGCPISGDHITRYGLRRKEVQGRLF